MKLKRIGAVIAVLALRMRPKPSLLAVLTTGMAITTELRTTSILGQAQMPPVVIAPLR